MIYWHLRERRKVVGLSFTYIMNKVEVRNKIRRVLSEMLLGDLDSGVEIPQGLSDHILENYGWTNKERPYSREELQHFVKRLQKWFEDMHRLTVGSQKIGEMNFDFEVEFEKYIEAESEFCEVVSELSKLLQEVIKLKDGFSKHFKEKCKAQESLIKVLSGKCQFLKHQFLLKLYGENSALCGHLALERKLKKDLESLRENYNGLSVTSMLYDEIKNDENFHELLKMYGELRKIEKRTEIIGQI